MQSMYCYSFIAYASYSIALYYTKYSTYTLIIYVYVLIVYVYISIHFTLTITIIYGVLYTGVLPLHSKILAHSRIKRWWMAPR